MSWLAVILLAAAAFAFAALTLKLPRPAWALFGAGLLFGLAGYGLQGSPGLEGTPAAKRTSGPPGDNGAVEARRALFDDGQPSRFVTISDAFARRGRYRDAANMLRNAVEEQPQDVEAWLALGNALVEHAEGRLTPAAEYAYAHAQALAPEHPGAPYFLGIAQLRAGDLPGARDTWAALLERAPEDAAWRTQLEQRVRLLDELIRRLEAR